MAPPVPTLWSAALRACFVGFSALGIDVERVRREAGIDAAALADPDGRVPFPLAARIWPAAHAQWQRPGLGLATGVALPFGELGVVDYAVASAPTVAEGLSAMTRVFRVVSHGATAFELIREPRGDALLRFSGAFPPEVRDYGIASFVRRLRELGAPPTEVSFVGPAFTDEGAYELALGARPRFDAADNHVRLSARDLDRARSDERYRGLAPIVGREVERLLSEIPEQTASAEVRRLIARLLPSGGAPDAALVARSLGVSQRTLQRRLADEGTSLRALVESTREALALSYLSSDRLRIAEVAYLLGYSEPGTFTTAFKRWRGIAPSEHRASTSPRAR